MKRGGGDGGACTGRLMENIVHFARVLRAAGRFPGAAPGRMVDAAAALRATGIGSREDFYWTLHALFVGDPAEREMFAQAFHVFWRNPRLLERLRGLLLPQVKAPPAGHHALPRRLSDALYPGVRKNTAPDDAEAGREAAALAWSARERLAETDFAAMSAAEAEEARRALARMKLPLPARPSRRRRKSAGARHSTVDLRAALRLAVRHGGAPPYLPKKTPRPRPPAVVALCDISGSMQPYSRMLLHFLHALCARPQRRVHGFVFGTRLSNITRHLRRKDVDLALARVADAVRDFGGGTRIGDCVRAFNRDWSRRLPLHDALVLFISDGLDRADGEGVAFEMARLRRSCRRLLWLNPLLRYREFRPLAAGVRAILPEVHELRAVHNLNSVAALSKALQFSDALAVHRR